MIIIYEQYYFYYSYFHMFLNTNALIMLMIIVYSDIIFNILLNTTFNDINDNYLWAVLFFYLSTFEIKNLNKVF